jgi:DNA polymerase III subunit gamma/tau
MSYQVIARKYRPQRFRDVVGQEHVTQTLSHAIEQKRIAHAYLFCGPRGTGKTTIARIFAKCLECTNGPMVDFDDNDPRCREIAEGRSLDVLEIDGASNNGVEQVRELRETCKYAPAASPFKIYIIDEVHMLSTAAFNALLKTLEEPPAHVKFMFATTDPEKVLPTILSRCQRYDLRRIPASLISNHLAEIAKQEQVQIEPAALYAIARGAEGAMRDAESTLDQLISFCGTKIEESDVLSMFGLAAQGQLLELSRAVLSGDVGAALRQLNDLAGNGKDLGRLLSDLLNHFRNLLIFQVSRGDVKMLEVSEAEAESLAEQIKSVTPEGLTRILEVFADAEMRLRDATSKKILVEVALLKAIEARQALSIDSVLKQLRHLQGGGRGGEVVTIPMSTPAPAPAPAPKPFRAAASAAAPAAPVAAPKVEVTTQPAVLHEAATTRPPTPPPADLETLWAQLLEAIPPITRMSLAQGHPVSFNKERGVFTVGFAPDHAHNLGFVDNARNQALLQARLQELGHANGLFKFIKAEPSPGRVPVSAPAPAAPAPAPAAAPAAKAPTPATATKAAAPAAAAPQPEKPTPVPFDKETFKNDPLIQKALELFKGQLVEVRA